jgi:hypothetical protein
VLHGPRSIDRLALLAAPLERRVVRRPGGPRTTDTGWSTWTAVGVPPGSPPAVRWNP